MPAHSLTGLSRTKSIVEIAIYITSRVQHLYEYGIIFIASIDITIATSKVAAQNSDKYVSYLVLPSFLVSFVGQMQHKMSISNSF